MKIDEITQMGLPLPQPEKKEGAESRELDFQKILGDAKAKLNDAMQGPDPTPSDKEAGLQVSPTTSLHPVHFLLGLQDMDLIRSQGLQATENTLEMLEAYQRAMADPEASLKKIDPLVQSLSREVGNITILSGKLSPSDPLQRILTELGIICSVEIEKFNRGEYI